MNTETESTTFPLYDSIVDHTKNINKDLKKSEKEDFIESVKSINDKGAELIYALITMHHRKENNQEGINLPYNGSFVENGVVEFNLGNFPKKLRRILYTFLKIHFKKNDVIKI
jgi:hypothetical protein